jgi:hypothetical protein
MENLVKVRIIDEAINSEWTLDNPELLREVKLLQGREDCFNKYPECQVTGCRWRESCVPNRSE